MSSPPDPAISLNIILALAGFVWRPVARDASVVQLGEFATADGSARHLLAVGGTSVGSIQWTLEAAMPAKMARFLISEPDATMLKTSEACADGAAMVRRTRYVLRAEFDGSHHVARLIAA